MGELGPGLPYPCRWAPGASRPLPSPVLQGRLPLIPCQSPRTREPGQAQRQGQGCGVGAAGPEHGAGHSFLCPSPAGTLRPRLSSRPPSPPCPTRYATPPGGATTSSVDLAWQRATLYAASPAARSAPLRSGPLTACHAPKRGTVSHRPKHRYPGKYLTPPYTYMLGRHPTSKISPRPFCPQGNPGRKTPPRHRLSQKIL
jgi:hypothetical protein